MEREEMTDTYRHFKSTKDEEIEDLKTIIGYKVIEIENLKRQLKDSKWEKMKSFFSLIFWIAGTIFCLVTLGWLFTSCAESSRIERLRTQETCMRICNAVDMQVMECEQYANPGPSAVNCISDGHFERFNF